MRRARVKDERQWPTPSSSQPHSLPWPPPLFPHTSSSPSPSGLVSLLWTKSMGITINSVEDAAVAWEVDGADEDGDSNSLVRFAYYICHVADVLGSSAVVGGEGHRGRAATSAQLCLAWMSLLRLPPKHEFFYSVWLSEFILEPTSKKKVGMNNLQGNQLAQFFRWNGGVSLVCEGCSRGN